MRTDTRCGTNAGYAAHIRAGQATCNPCRNAHARATKRYQVALHLGEGVTVPVTGTRRRIQALATQGWNTSVVFRLAGLPVRPMVKLTSGRIDRDKADKIATLYDQLWNQTPPQSTGRERAAATEARNLARRHGWAPPLAWDNIDHDLEPVKGSIRVSI